MYQLQNIVNKLIIDIKRRYFLLGRESQKVYSLMLKTVLQAVDQARFTEVESNLLLRDLINDVRLLVIEINSILRERIAESSLYLKTAINILDRMKGSMEPLHILLCDSLSISECMFLSYIFPRFIDIDKMFFAINPSGKTATFKYLAKEYLGIETEFLEEVTLRNICEALREKLGAFGCSLFRDIDMLIHHGGNYGNINQMTNSLFRVVSKLCGEIEKLMNNKYKVLIMADHGYDILKRDSLWALTHGWEREKLCLSPFVPIIILG